MPVHAPDSESVVRVGAWAGTTAANARSQHAIMPLLSFMTLSSAASEIDNLESRKLDIGNR
jgi:hypothetical protein